MKFLTILNWTLWSALFIALVYALVMILTERSRTPKGGRALGIFLLALGLLFSATTGGVLHQCAQKGSVAGLIIMALVLAWPLMPLIARPIGMAIKDWKYSHSKNAEANLSAS